MGLLRNVFDETGTLGKVPVLIWAYFDIILENSGILSGMVSSGSWCDGASLLGTVTDGPIESYKPAFGTSSRTDMIFLNSASSVLSKCGAVPAPEHGIKRHEPVQCDLDLQQKRKYADQIERSENSRKGKTSDEEEICDMRSQ